jgi:RNA polymerase sigma factor (sigma-70 family)
VKLGQLVLFRPAEAETISDEGLAAACAAGDRAAQSLVYERHVDDIFRFIARSRRAEQDIVEDLVQATFIAAFRSAGSFRGPKLRSWLFGIACNVMRAHVRKEVARRRIATSYGEEPAPEARAPEDADIRRLRLAIEKLPTKYRDVILLVDLQDERGTDAARTLGIPEGTLWRRLSEARAVLRELLGGDS